MRPARDDMDLTPLLSRVTFQLHPSFNSPSRVVEKAPFEAN